MYAMYGVILLLITKLLFYAKDSGVGCVFFYNVISNYYYYCCYNDGYLFIEEYYSYLLLD